MARKRTVKDTKQAGLNGSQQATELGIKPRITAAPAPVIQPKAPPVAITAVPRTGGNLPAAQPSLDSEPKSTSNLKSKVRFALVDLGASAVFLSGQFNSWSPNANPMKMRQGTWEATVELAPGRYEYKYIVDGQWMPDPLATQNVYNEHGTLNSVLEVRG